MLHPSQARGNDGENIEFWSEGINFTLKGQMHNSHFAFQLIRSEWTLVMVIFTFPANRLGSQSLSLIVHYASKRYGWEIKKATYLLSLRAATKFVAITVSIPPTNLVLLKVLCLPTQ